MYIFFYSFIDIYTCLSRWGCFFVFHIDTRDALTKGHQFIFSHCCIVALSNTHMCTPRVVYDITYIHTQTRNFQEFNPQALQTLKWSIAIIYIPVCECTMAISYVSYIVYSNVANYQGLFNWTTAGLSLCPLTWKRTKERKRGLSHLLDHAYKLALFLLDNPLIFFTFIQVVFWSSKYIIDISLLFSSCISFPHFRSFTFFLKFLFISIFSYPILIF